MTNYQIEKRLLLCLIFFCLTISCSENRPLYESETNKKDSNIYQLKSVERFPIKYDNDGNSINATFESDIQWIVHDQLLFNNACGDIKFASTIIKDLYPAALKSVRYGSGYFNEIQHGKSIKKIISSGNENFQQRYGIKIIDLKVKVIINEN